MFTVRPFDGTPEELSEFVISAWKSTYAGTMAVPHWSGDYFRWQLRLDEPDAENRTLTVYDGETPAGTMLHFPMTFQVAAEMVEAAQASWLSVPPAYRGKGIAHRLSEETRRVLRAQGRLCDLRPSDASPLQERARLAFQAGRHDEAIHDLERALGLAKGDEALRSVTKQLDQVRRWTQAMRWRSA